MLPGVVLVGLGGEKCIPGVIVIGQLFEVGEVSWEG